MLYTQQQRDALDIEVVADYLVVAAEYVEEWRTVSGQPTRILWPAIYPRLYPSERRYLDTIGEPYRLPERVICLSATDLGTCIAAINTAQGTSIVLNTELGSVLAQVRDAFDQLDEQTSEE